MEIPCKDWRVKILKSLVVVGAIVALATAGDLRSDECQRVNGRVAITVASEWPIGRPPPTLPFRPWPRIAAAGGFEGPLRKRIMAA